MVDFILLEFMEERLKNTSIKFHRYLYNNIHWDRRMIGLLGPRGIGKSTMMLQYILENRDNTNMLYVTADHMYFATHSLIEVAEAFILEGGEWLCIDEVHKYPGWSRELKQLYEMYPKLRIAFTGSSILEINKGEADLSRRALFYMMQGMSFREYLELFHGITNRIYTLEEILQRKVKIEGIEHPIPLFREYLKEGYYPFSIEGDFDKRMMQILNTTLEGDIPQSIEIKSSTARKLKQLLGVVAKSAPYKPNMESLATEIGVSKNNISEYLTWIEKSGLIGQLRDDTSGFRGLGKVEKVYIDNPSLMSVLGGDTANKGNIRETFFYNQMRLNNVITSSRIADFQIGEYTFEIGGHGKTQRQLVGAKKGLVVKDDIELALGNVIPLYHFGFNY